jgi:hypothetical protein
VYIINLFSCIACFVKSSPEFTFRIAHASRKDSLNKVSIVSLSIDAKLGLYEYLPKEPLTARFPPPIIDIYRNPPVGYYGPFSKKLHVHGPVHIFITEANFYPRYSRFIFFRLKTNTADVKKCELKEGITDITN